MKEYENGKIREETQLWCEIDAKANEKRVPEVWLEEFDWPVVFEFSHA